MDEPNGIELRILDARIHTWGIPRYQSEMAAAVDLFACIEEPLVLEAQSPAQLVSSGIALHIGDPQIAAIVVPRSGLGHRTGLVMGNLVGVVDADYTGPVMISVWNRNAVGSEPIVVRPGDRIAQMVFVPVLRPRFVVVEEFTRNSVRGEGGFGSTGHALPASAP